MKWRKRERERERERETGGREGRRISFLRNGKREREREREEREREREYKFSNFDSALLSER